MAERMNPTEMVTVEELLHGCLYEQEAMRRLLVRKGLLTTREILDELKPCAGSWGRTKTDSLMCGRFTLMTPFGVVIPRFGVQRCVEEEYHVW